MAEEDLENLLGEEVSPEEGEDSEEEDSEPKGSEPKSSEPEVPQKPAVSPEALELFNSVRKEVGEKRFDGLMSAWQGDRQRMLKLEDELRSLKEEREEDMLEEDLETSQSSTEEGEEEGEEWVDHIRTKIKEKDIEEQKAEDFYVNKELNQIKRDYPDLKEEEVLKFAIKHSEDENNPMSLSTAANILSEIQKREGLTKEMLEEEKKRKREAAGISGRTEASTPPGLRPFSKKRDKGKSLKQLGREGMEELEK